MAKTIKLQCWVYRDDVESIFPVKISKMETVGDLKIAVKNEKFVTFRDVEADKLQLYSILISKNVDETLEHELMQLSLEDKSPLNSRTKISKLPPSKKGQEVLVVVVGPDSGSSAIDPGVSRNLQLNCLVRGNNSRQYFCIKIAGTANVYDLKELIKQKKANEFRNIDANTLDLYEVSLPIDGELDEKLRNLMLDVPLDPRTKLWTYFAQIVEENIHILVKQHDNRLQVGEHEQDDVITALTESFKRTITMSQNLTPSKAAKSSEYVKIQCGDGRLLDCRCAAAEPASTVAPAIQLFSPVFAYFSSRAFDPEYDVPDDFALNIWNLMTRFGLIYASERDRRNHLITLLEMAIGRPLEAIVGSDNTTPDFVALSSCEELSVYLIIGEEKNEIGDGGSDPSVQAAFSFLHIFRQQKNAGLLMRCCCPTFIVAHAGPWLTIMGGIITDKCIVQRLTDLLWVPVHSLHDADQYCRIARIFYALRESTQRLDLWYKTIKTVTPYDISTPRIHPRFFPTPNTYRYKNNLVKFVYQTPLEQSDSCVTYLASTIGDMPKDIVVKFITGTSYGEDAHKRMASLGFAPELFYYGPIKVTDDMPSYGKLRMVVMGYVKGLTLEAALQQRKVPPRFKDDLTRAFEQLHGADYVFGDVREPNIIVTPDLEGTPSTAQLIDFDWAGKEAEVKYPISISSSISWPEGVKGLGRILKKHDNAMLAILVSRCSRYQPADPKGKRRAIDTPPGQSPSKKPEADEEDMDVDKT